MTIATVENSMIVQVWNKHFVPVQDFNQASQEVRNFIYNNDLGGSEWCNKHNGNIYDIDGKIVAKVSYNGRVWANNGTEILTK